MQYPFPSKEIITYSYGKHIYTFTTFVKESKQLEGSKHKFYYFHCL